MTEVKSVSRINSASVSAHLRKFGAVYAFLLLVIVNAVSDKHFLAVNTLWNLLIQAFPIIITSLGMLFVISSGGIAVCARKTHFTMDEF